MSWISIFSWGLVQTTLRASMPIIFAALAAVLTQNAGILNVGIEGGMLIGALTAVCANAATGSWVVGVLASIAAAELYSLVIAVAHLRFRANVFAVGSILNIMAAALTGFILNTAYGVSGYPRLRPEGSFSPPGRKRTERRGERYVGSCVRGYRLCASAGFPAVQNRLGTAGQKRGTVQCGGAYLRV